ncbi:torsin-1B-like [Uloborus diversus]|uniref:torsin-1B-like n=1 Tax=Uloborus diversus TaxID=327109 RepID=UPI00240A6170|nr:torsin-1B-like [Uloborus diversus]
MPELESSLKKRLFGQHLVNMVVPKSLKAHTGKSSPKKALVMAFHGWTGSGKNYVSKMIAENLYKLGSKSSFVHWYIATHDFPHASEKEEYREKLRKEIPEFTKRCGQSLFIFDEVDKMVPGVIDVLAPFLDFYETVDGVDYRKNIFIFLSNAGGSEITRIAFNFWLDGRDRTEITLKDIEPLINIGAFNEEGGLKGNKIIEKNLIDVYVPFLPLEKSHVLECIKKELIERGQPVNDVIASEVAKEIVYYPTEFQLFSSSGCKKISHKVDLFGMP